MEAENNLRVIFYRTGEGWTAQCLEHNICAFADDLRELQRRFEATFQMECEISEKLHGVALAEIPPAPQEFHKMWNECAGKYEPSGNPKLSERKLDFALCA
jgi:hypothetical protein